MARKFRMNRGVSQDMILNGPVGKTLLFLAVPIILNNLSGTLYNLVDTFWVGKIGGAELAAISFVWPISYLLISVGMGMSTAGTALVSQYLGNGQYRNAQHMSGQIFSYTMVLSVILGIIGYFIAEPAMLLMGANAEVFEPGSIYLKIGFLTLPFPFISYIFSSVKSAEGNTVLPMVLSFAGNILNAILDPVCILLLDWGIAGAAIATAASQAVSAAVSLWLLFKGKNGIHLRKKDLKLVGKEVALISRIGIPSIAGMSMTSIGFCIMNSFVLSFGTSVMTAMSVGNRISNLFGMPAAGVAQALSTVIGQNLGAENLDRCKLTMKRAAQMVLTCGVVSGLIMFVGSPVLTGLFAKKDPVAWAESIVYLRYLAVSGIFMGLFDMFYGLFRGSGHTGQGMIIETVRLWVFRIPMLVLLPMVMGRVSIVVWTAMVLSNALSAGVGYIMYLGGRWKKRVIRGQKPEEEPAEA